MECIHFEPQMGKIWRGFCSVVLASLKMQVTHMVTSFMSVIIRVHFPLSLILHCKCYNVAISTLEEVCFCAECFFISGSLQEAFLFSLSLLQYCICCYELSFTFIQYIFTQ